MIGNVWEWTDDCWHDNYRGRPADGGAWQDAHGGQCDRHVIRGGGYGSGARVDRSATRDAYATGGGRADLGFRVARNLP